MDASCSRPEPIGVKFLSSPADAWDGLALFEGTSYCQAVSQACEKSLLVRASSITTCRWSPVVLGLKQPDGSFEKRLEPAREATWGIALATLPSFSQAGVEPDVVVLRDSAGALKSLLEKIGPQHCAMQYAGQMDRSALGSLQGGHGGWKERLIGVVNPTLSLLNKIPGWGKATELLFRNRLVSDLFDRLIAMSMADMSVCRNSTVIPAVTGKANLSHFCTGGVTWGMNRPEHMACGVPYALYAQL